MIKLIEENKVTYAKIIRASYEASEVEFFTRESDEVQFGVVNFQKNFKTDFNRYTKTQVYAQTQTCVK